MACYGLLRPPESNQCMSAGVAMLAIKARLALFKQLSGHALVWLGWRKKPYMVALFQGGEGVGRGHVMAVCVY